MEGPFIRACERFSSFIPLPIRREELLSIGNAPMNPRDVLTPDGRPSVQGSFAGSRVGDNGGRIGFSLSCYLLGRCLGVIPRMMNRR